MGTNNFERLVSSFISAALWGIVISTSSFILHYILGLTQRILGMAELSNREGSFHSILITLTLTVVFYYQRKHGE